MQKCNQCGYERQEKDSIIDSNTCPRCGIIYEKCRPDSIRPAKPALSRISNSPALNRQRPANPAVSNINPFLKYAVLVCLILFLVFLLIPNRENIIPRTWQLFFDTNKFHSLEYRLEKAVNDLNSRCPVMLAKDGRLDAVYYEAEKNKVTFSCTLVNIAYKDLPGYGRDDVLEKAKSYALKYIKQDEKCHVFQDNKISLTMVFKTNDAVEYGRLRIVPSDYY